METLKRILTVMVVVLVLIIVVGGFYTFSMGNMNHDTGGQMNMTTVQNENTGNRQSQITEKTGSPVQTPQDQSKDANDYKESSQAPLPVPIIIQPPPEPKTDPRVYVEQLKEKLKEINTANALIASNAGGQAMVSQSNGSGASTDQFNMNELHEGLYKLGQNISSMEQTLDNLSRSIASDAGTQSYNGATYYYGTPQDLPVQPQLNYYPYGYPQNYSQYNPYAASANQQMPQVPQANNSADQMNSMNSNMQMNHSSFNLSGLLTANNIKLVFTIMLIGSLILGIVAVIGFIGSLFKPKKVTQNSVQI